MKFDICSVGSALVDFTFSIDKEYEKNLIKYGIPKGSMTLIEKEDQEVLINDVIDLDANASIFYKGTPEILKEKKVIGGVIEHRI